MDKERVENIVQLRRVLLYLRTIGGESNINLSNIIDKVLTKLMDNLILNEEEKQIVEECKKFKINQKY